MQLVKVYFDAYKSLQNKELNITDNCIGLVGINESGKSNILRAINHINTDNPLSINDAPKANKTINPKLRFEFELSENEQRDVSKIIDSWIKGKTATKIKIKPEDLNIVYHIEIDSETKKEKRFISLNNSKIDLDKNFVLLKNFLSDLDKIKIRDSFIPISHAVIIDFCNYEKNHNIYKDSVKLQKIKNEINELEVLKNQITKHDANDSKKSTSSSNLTFKENLQELSNKIKSKQSECEKIQKNLDGYDVVSEKKKLEDNINKLNSDIQKKENNLKIISSADTVKSPPREITSSINKIKAEINNLKNRLFSQEKELEQLNTHIMDKYTQDSQYIIPHLESLLEKYLIQMLPDVVFWTYQDSLTIEAETFFEDIIDNKDFTVKLKPLYNVLKTGLNISSSEELNDKLKKLKTSPTERCKASDTLKTKINKYIENAWSNFNQKIDIRLERDHILFSIYDPEIDDPNYFNMNERSQGAKTFISFLLTIGSAVEQGIINNMILLIDEPETHLHPSGVRFMLDELIKISDKDNQVIYATHSIFMIDRKNYDRHIILEKRNQKTNIIPSRKDRVGCFLQEEVLYSTLDFHFDKDLSSLNEHNFVFEGDGDTSLFEYYYNLLQNKPFEIKKSSFFHGGGCTNIEKFLNRKPIQLGSKWIFILDKDKPAEGLKKMIEGKYREFLKKYVYVFQYNLNDGKTDNVELENLLPTELLDEVYSITESKFENIDSESVRGIIENHNCNGVSKEEVSDVKGVFKECLNSHIKAKLNGIKKQEDFESTFPEYSSWAKSVINEINKSLSEK